MKSLEFKFVLNLYLAGVFLGTALLNSYNEFYKIFFLLITFYFVVNAHLIIFWANIILRKIVNKLKLINNLFLSLVLAYFIIKLWIKFSSNAIIYSSFWILVLVFYFIKEFRKSLNISDEQKIILDKKKLLFSFLWLFLTTIFLNIFYIDKTNFNDSKENFVIFKEKISYWDFIKKDNLFTENKAKTLLENIDFEWIFDDHKETQNSFLTANSLSTSEIVRFKKIYLKTKWNLDLKKWENYIYTNYISLWKLYLVLWNYYLINLESDKAKEVYIDLINKNSQILKQNSMMSLLVYNWIMQRILQDIELNKNIFKIKDLREIVKALDNFNAKNALSFAFNEEYLFNYNQLKDFPSIPVIFNTNSYLDKLEYKYIYQINNKWEDYFKDYKPSLLKSNFILNNIFVAWSDNTDRIQDAFEIEEKISNLKQTY